MTRGGPVRQGPLDRSLDRLASSQGDGTGVGCTFGQLVGMADQQELESEQADEHQYRNPGYHFDNGLPGLAGSPCPITFRDHLIPPARFPEGRGAGLAASPRP